MVNFNAGYSKDIQNNDIRKGKTISSINEHLNSKHEIVLSTAKILSGTFLVGVLGLSYDFEKEHILLNNNSENYKVIGTSENSILGDIIGTKRDFKSLKIIKNETLETLSFWEGKSGAQHIGISYIQPDSFKGDNSICWGSENFKPNAYNCYNDIRISALKTKLGKNFISNLSK